MKRDKPDEARAQFSARKAEDRPTIVGGRPPEQQTRPGNFSQGIEKVILLAALDKEFRAELFADREKALDSCEIELSQAERAVLLSIPDEQLENAMERTEVPEPARRALLRGVAKAGVIALLGTVLAGTSCADDYVSMGIQPDREYIEQAEPTDTAPDSGPSDKHESTRGIRPDRGFVKPVRPTDTDKDAPDSGDSDR